MIGVAGPDKIDNKSKRKIFVLTSLLILVKQVPFILLLVFADVNGWQYKLRFLFLHFGEGEASLMCELQLGYLRIVIFEQ